MANEIAVISQPTQQVQTTPAKSAASIWSKSSASTAVTETHDQRVTRQELADYEETRRRMKPEHIALAQKLMATYGGEQVRNAVAAAGIGSNVWVMDLAARIQMALDAKDAEIAALKRNQR